MSKLFEVLYAINQNEKASQRYLATTCDISVGKVNNLIKEAQLAGYLTINQNETKQRYQLTTAGFAVIGNYLTEQNNLKIRFESPKNEPVTTAVILAAGWRRDFKQPVAFLSINEQTALLERTVQILFENKIEDIVIVTGYKAQYFTDFVKQYPKIKLVHNESYQNSGTMKSLSLVEGVVSSDFILIESDIIFEKKALKRLIEHPENDCMIITNESGSGDEALVEIRNNYIYNMSKDKHQLNKIDGEMIGLTKISYAMFKKMMERFATNQNPYLNYEYMLMDIGRKYKIGFVKIGDLLWWEFDTLAHYEKFEKSIYRILCHQEQIWHYEAVKTTVATALGIEKEAITAIGYVGGLTNTSYKVTIANQNYIARIPGAGTEDLISRVNEKTNCEMANQLALDAKIIYINPENGIKIAEFLEGVETLTPAMTKRPEIMREVTKLIKKLHNSGVLLENDFDVFAEMRRYEQLAQNGNAYLFSDYEKTKKRVLRLEKVLEKLGHNRVACHNDTGYFNILKDQDDRYYLIDWEYAGNNDPVWDLAAHSLESDFSKDEELLLLQTYFATKDVCETDLIKLLVFQICQDFLWAVWTCIKEAKGENFGSYGRDRYERAKSKLAELEAWDVFGNYC